MVRSTRIALFALLALFTVTRLSVSAADLALADRLLAWSRLAREGRLAAEKTDAATALAHYETLDADWEAFEDAVRAADADDYVALEDALSAVKKLYRAKSDDATAYATVYAEVEARAGQVSMRYRIAATAGKPADALRGLASLAGTGADDAAAGDIAAAQADYALCHDFWEAFEDAIRELDAKAYVALEDDLSAIKKLARADAVDGAALATAFAKLQATCVKVAEAIAPASAEQGSTGGSGGTGGQEAAPTPAAEAGSAAGLDVQTLGHLDRLALLSEAGAKLADAGAATVALQAAYTDVDAHWQEIEDGIRALDPGAYVDLESALSTVRKAVAAAPVDHTAVASAFQALSARAQEMLHAPVAAAPAATPDAYSMSAFVAHIVASREAAERQDAAAARAALDQAVRIWPVIEGQVAVSDAAAYEAIETDLGAARSALRADPADVSAATAALTRLQAAGEAADTDRTYTLFDAASVVLREGFEALLVLVALIAFLKKTGNGDKQRWIWGGAGAGLVASVAAGFVLQYLFSKATAGGNRELVEGITGLAAAAMLFYVSYWLHSKSSFHSWQKFIHVKTTNALKKGSLMGLALLAFLAVFREGAETVVFYLGMAPSIAMRDLVLGFAIASVILIAVAVLVLLFGVRLPLRQFFIVAGILVYYLGFKFVGHGILALQAADVIPPLHIAHMPAIPALGIYPTWAALLPQLALLVLAIGLLFWMHRGSRDAGRAAAPRPA